MLKNCNKIVIDGHFWIPRNTFLRKDLTAVSKQLCEKKHKWPPQAVDTLGHGGLDCQVLKRTGARNSNYQLTERLA